MKEKSFIFIISMFLVSLALSCENVLYETHSSEVFVSLTTPNNIGDYKVVGELKYNTKAIFLALQLITIKDSEIEKAINKQVKKSDGDGVINLTIHEQYDIVDIVISVFVGGLINTRTVKVNGDIIKMNPASMTDIPEVNDQIELAIVDYNNDINR